MQLDHDVDVLGDRPAWRSSWVTCGPASIAQVTSFRIAPSASLRAWVVEIDPAPDSIALIIASDLLAADLADDLPGQVEPERVGQAPGPG